MTRVQTWLAQYAESNPPQTVGVFFEVEGTIHHAFLGLPGFDQDFREHEPDAEELSKRGVTSVAGFKNWLYYWTTMLGAGKGMDHFIEKESPYYAVIEGDARTFDNGVSLAAIHDELRADLLHVEGRERGVSEEGVEQDPRTEDDVATLIEEGCWLVPRHGEELRQVAMWALRGGELDPESKRLKVRYAWLVDPLRKLHQLYAARNEELYAAEVGSVLNHAMRASLEIADGVVLDGLGRLVVNVFARLERSRRVDLWFMFELMSVLRRDDLDTLSSGDGAKVYWVVERRFRRFERAYFHRWAMFHDPEYMEAELMNLSRLIEPGEPNESASKNLKGPAER